MRHIAEGTRVKKPFKPRNQTKEPSTWQEKVRKSLRKQRGNLNHKKANSKTPWRSNRDGFMVTSREHQPTENQLDSLERQRKTKQE